jgi:hypothetical protein
MSGFSDSHHFRKMVAGAAMVGAPLFALIAYVVIPKLHTDEGAQLGSIAAHADRWFAAAVFSALAIVCAMLATLGLMHMLRERRPVHAAIGGTLAFAGLAAWLCQTGVALMLWQMTKDGVQASDVSAFQGLSDSFGSALVLFWMPLLTAVGYAVLATGMFGAHVVDRWMAAMIGIAPVLLAVAGFAASVPVGLIGSALLLVGLGATGLMVLRESDADWEHTPDWQGFRPAAGMR